MKMALISVVLALVCPPVTVGVSMQDHSKTCCRKMAHIAILRACVKCRKGGADCRLCAACAKLAGECSHCTVQAKPVPKFNAYSREGDGERRKALDAMEGKKAPSWQVEQWVQGKTTLKELKGKVVLLDFWGVW